MAAGSRVLKHPDREEIDQRLLNGEPPIAVSKWLKRVHPKESRKHLSSITLQHYRSNYLNVKGDVLKDLKAANREIISKGKFEEEKALVNTNLEVMEKKKEVMDDIIDTNKEIMKVHDLIWERIELMKQQEVHYQNDRVIADYISQARALMTDYHKLVKGMADQRIEHTIKIEEVRGHVNVLKEAIQETLCEINNPALTSLFLDKMNKKIKELEEPTKIDEKEFFNNFEEVKGKVGKVETSMVVENA
jgi:hypothetical protein